MSSDDDNCPCGTGRPYGKCCGVWHAGLPAPTAEQLMRSRYSAFVCKDAQYLLATWHASRRPRRIVFDEGQTWLGLSIVDTRESGTASAEVEFIARSAVNGKALRHRERSRFVREEGRWFYVDGDLS